MLLLGLDIFSSVSNLVGFQYLKFVSFGICFSLVLFLKIYVILCLGSSSFLFQKFTTASVMLFLVSYRICSDVSVRLFLLHLNTFISSYFPAVFFSVIHDLNCDINSSEVESGETHFS